MRAEKVFVEAPALVGRCDQASGEEVFFPLAQTANTPQPSLVSGMKWLLGVLNHHAQTPVPFRSSTPLGSTTQPERDSRQRRAGAVAKLRRVRGLSEEGEYLFARSLIATPDERWSLHEDFLRSHDLFTRSARRTYGFR